MVHLVNAVCVLVCFVCVACPFWRWYGASAARHATELWRSCHTVDAGSIETLLYNVLLLSSRTCLVSVLPMTRFPVAHVVLLLGELRQVVQCGDRAAPLSHATQYDNHSKYCTVDVVVV